MNRILKLTFHSDCRISAQSVNIFFLTSFFSLLTFSVHIFFKYLLIDGVICCKWLKDLRQAVRIFSLAQSHLFFRDANLTVASPNTACTTELKEGRQWSMEKYAQAFFTETTFFLVFCCCFWPLAQVITHSCQIKECYVYFYISQ